MQSWSSLSSLATSVKLIKLLSFGRSERDGLERGRILPIGEHHRSTTPTPAAATATAAASNSQPAVTPTAAGAPPGHPLLTPTNSSGGVVSSVPSGPVSSISVPAPLSPGTVSTTLTMSAAPASGSSSPHSPHATLTGAAGDRPTIPLSPHLQQPQPQRQSSAPSAAPSATPAPAAMTTAASSGADFSQLTTPLFVVPSKSPAHHQSIAAAASSSILLQQPIIPNQKTGVYLPIKVRSQSPGVGGGVSGASTPYDQSAANSPRSVTSSNGDPNSGGHAASASASHDPHYQPPPALYDNRSSTASLAQQQQLLYQIQQQQFMLQQQQQQLALQQQQHQHHLQQQQQLQSSQTASSSLVPSSSTSSLSSQQSHSSGTVSPAPAPAVLLPARHHTSQAPPPQQHYSSPHKSSKHMQAQLSPHQQQQQQQMYGVYPNGAVPSPQSASKHSKRSKGGSSSSAPKSNKPPTPQSQVLTYSVPMHALASSQQPNGHYQPQSQSLQLQQQRQNWDSAKAVAASTDLLSALNISSAAGDDLEREWTELTRTNEAQRRELSKLQSSVSDYQRQMETSERLRTSLQRRLDELTQQVRFQSLDNALVHHYAPNNNSVPQPLPPTNSGGGGTVNGTPNHATQHHSHASPGDEASYIEDDSNSLLLLCSSCGGLSAANCEECQTRLALASSAPTGSQDSSPTRTAAGSFVDSELSTPRGTITGPSPVKPPSGAGGLPTSASSLSMASQQSGTNDALPPTHPSQAPAVREWSAAQVDTHLSHPSLIHAVDGMLSRYLAQRPDTHLGRITTHVKQLIRRTLSAHAYPHGCYALRTHLPESDICISAFFSRAQEKTWVQRFVNALLSESTTAAAAAAAAASDAGTGSVTPIDGQSASAVVISPAGGSGANATASSGAAGGGAGGGTMSEVAVLPVQYVAVNVGRTDRIVSFRIAGVSVHVSGNQVASLSSLALYEHADLLVGRSHLFKRTIVLVQAWANLAGVHNSNVCQNGCTFSAGASGDPMDGTTSSGLLSCAVLRTLVLFVFNAYHRTLTSPLHALWRLLCYVTQFDWNSHALSLYGPVQLAELPSMVAITSGPTAWPAVPASAETDAKASAAAAAVPGGLPFNPVPPLLVHDILKRYVVQTGAVPPSADAAKTPAASAGAESAVNKPAQQPQSDAATATTSTGSADQPQPETRPESKSNAADGTDSQAAATTTAVPSSLGDLLDTPSRKGSYPSIGRSSNATSASGSPSTIRSPADSRRNSIGSGRAEWKSSSRPPSHPIHPNPANGNANGLHSSNSLFNFVTSPIRSRAQSEDLDAGAGAGVRTPVYGRWANDAAAAGAPLPMSGGGCGDENEPSASANSAGTGPRYDSSCSRAHPFNVIDPVDSRRNVAAGVTRRASVRIRRAFADSYQNLARNIDRWSSMRQRAGEVASAVDLTAVLQLMFPPATVQAYMSTDHWHTPPPPAPAPVPTPATGEKVSETPTTPNTTPQSGNSVVNTGTSGTPVLVKRRAYSAPTNQRPNLASMLAPPPVAAGGAAAAAAPANPAGAGGAAAPTAPVSTTAPVGSSGSDGAVPSPVIAPSIAPSIAENGDASPSHARVVSGKWVTSPSKLVAGGDAAAGDSYLSSPALSSASGPTSSSSSMPPLWQSNPWSNAVLTTPPSSNSGHAAANGAGGSAAAAAALLLRLQSPMMSPHPAGADSATHTGSTNSAVVSPTADSAQITGQPPEISLVSSNPASLPAHSLAHHVATFGSSRRRTSGMSVASSGQRPLSTVSSAASLAFDDDEQPAAGAGGDGKADAFDGEEMGMAWTHGRRTSSNASANGGIPSAASPPPASDAFSGLSNSFADVLTNLGHAKQFDTPEISEEQLVSLVLRILEQRGSVSVGSMGSLLHDTTKNHSLPSLLKDRYGGLKRFLERYPQTFAVGADHPYNPHVRLVVPSSNPAAATHVAPPRANGNGNGGGSGGGGGGGGTQIHHIAVQSADSGRSSSRPPQLRSQNDTHSQGSAQADGSAYASASHALSSASTPFVPAPSQGAATRPRSTQQPQPQPSPQPQRQPNTQSVQPQPQVSSRPPQSQTPPVDATDQFSQLQSSPPGSVDLNAPAGSGSGKAVRRRGRSHNRLRAGATTASGGGAPSGGSTGNSTATNSTTSSGSATPTGASASASTAAVPPLLLQGLIPSPAANPSQVPNGGANRKAGGNSAPNLNPNAPAAASTATPNGLTPQQHQFLLAQQQSASASTLPLVAMDCELLSVSVTVSTPNTANSGSGTNTPTATAPPPPAATTTLTRHVVTRVTIVNQQGEIAYDTYIKSDVYTPPAPQQQAATAAGGGPPPPPVGVCDFRTAQRQVTHVLRGRLLVGHTLSPDLSALGVIHPKAAVRDVAFYKGLCPRGPVPLKRLVKERLGVDIQQNGRVHSTVENARAALALYKATRKQWETPAPLPAGPAIVSNAGATSTVATASNQTAAASASASSSYGNSQQPTASSSSVSPALVQPQMNSGLTPTPTAASSAPATNAGAATVAPVPARPPSSGSSRNKRFANFF